MKDKAERTVIAIERVTKRYGALKAIDAVSLDLAEGEFFALLGPSGCGKTTLLRAVAGFVRPDEGRVLLDGRDMTPLRPNKRPINMMFQSYALFPHMSVAANVAYGLEVEGVDRRETQRRVGEILEMTHLSDFASRKPDQLSGGQRQRVALARALVKRPRVLLLDEPLAALDKKLREQMQLELKRMQEEVGVTFVVVTHDQEEALVMADRMAVLRDGVVQQVGAPRTLYERPANRFVAGFIGKMNVFRGEAADGGLRVSGRLIRGDGDLAPAARPIAAVRPERLRLVDAPPADGEDAENALPGRILDIAYHGQDMNVRLSVEAAEDPVIVRLTADAAEAGDWSPGREVWCCWRREHTRLLADG